MEIFVKVSESNGDLRGAEMDLLGETEIDIHDGEQFRKGPTIKTEPILKSSEKD